MSLRLSELRERHIETRLIREVKKLNGIPYKFTSPQRRSVPDRLCIFHYGLIWFVECKRPGKKPTKAQWREINRLKTRGFNATYVDTYESIDNLILIIKKGLQKLRTYEIFS